MTPDGVENIYQLSPMQEGMLFHSLYQPGADPYVDQSGCTLEGDLDTRALRRAWGDLVARHPVLRTAFHWQELEHPLQVVFRDAETPWQEKDWRDLDPQAWQARLAAWLDDDRRRGFDLATAPLLRLTLIRESDRRVRFLWTHHHLILDGWSLPLVLRELLAAYASRRSGETPRLGPPPRPYADYIGWLQGRSLETAESFWRRTLAGFSAATPLGLAVATPADASTPSADRPERVDRELRLPPATTRALEELARRFRVTLSTMVHGAWALLLSRYSGRRDVAFGTVVSGRPPQLEGSETMVGLFINTVPVRLRLPPTARLSTWLADLQRLQLEIREHEHAPLAEVQKWSDVAPKTPLFDTILAFENYPRDPSLWDQTGGLAVRDFITIEHTNYGVSLSIVPEERLWLRLTHDLRQLSAAAMGRLLGHLATLLTAMTEAPDGELRELSMLTAGERRQVLVEWNRNAGGKSPEGALHQLFEARAAELPEAVAVACEDASGLCRSLSYGELERRSARLAARLAARGVAPEVRVGLAFEHSPELVLAILAVLRAGGAWVPLDPSYPRPRLAFMAADAGLGLVLAQPAAAPLLGELVPGGRVLTLEMLEEPAGTAAADTTAAPATPEVDPDHLAYVIYTSGSTGRPKGVMVRHRGAVSLVAAEQRLFGAAAGDRVLAFASPSFDVSVWETWMALAAGATLELAAPRDLLPGPDLAALVDRRRISHLTLPPSTLAVLPVETRTEATWAPVLRQLISAAETCPAAVAARFSRGRRFWNAYGPTEITVCATVEECRPGAGRPPIGRPLDRLRAYVLGPDLEPMPVAVAGELLIGGVGVARGYLGRPALTAERFVPDPFAGPGARLYRSGDRVCWLADGRLEFLGRIDHQLKLRGYRIEPGEIEATLASHPRVRDSVVVARPMADGPTRLVAYVVEAPNDGAPAEGAGELAAALRGYLRQRLPEHLVPALFVPLAALPRTPAGKVDRAALPPPAPVAAVPDGDDDPETWMRQLWAEVLQVEEVAADDDFFALGGDSILSIQLLSRLAERDVHLTPRQIFDHPTPARLARAARLAEARRAEQGPVTGPLPLLPIQRWFFDRAFADPHHWNLALLVEIRGEVDRPRLETALRHLVDHHDGLRWRCTRDGDGDGVRAWLAEPGVAVPLTAVDLAAGDLEPVLAELQASLDLERGPMFRAALIERGPGRAPRLLLIFHHLVVDAVSLGTLLLDLERAEGQLAAGEPVRLPPKTSSVRELAEALERAKALERAAPADRTTEPLPEPTPALPADVPADVAAGEISEDATDPVEVELPAATTEALLNQAQEAYSTRVEEMLLAALALAFARHTGRNQLDLHLEGYGRQALAGELDLSRTVGWLTTLTPVLLDLEEPRRRGDDVAEVLKTVKEQLRALPGAGDPGPPDSGPPPSPPFRGDPQLSFNYLGRMDRMMAAADRFLPVEGPLGPLRSPRGQPPHPLAVNAVVLDGRLRLFWTYRPDVHRRATLETLARGHRSALEEIVDHCLSPEAGGFTPSDFPAAELDQKSLDKFLGKLGGSR